MVIAGLLLAVAGFVVSLMSLSVASAPGARLAIILAGIALSLTGIFGLVNRAYLKHAIWKR